MCGEGKPPKWGRTLVLVPAACLPTCSSLVHSSWLFPLPEPLLFHSVLTELYLLSALTKGRDRKTRLFIWGMSYCLGQAGNWEWCTVGTISTWLSSSMNNTATLLALASACGAPLSLPPANTFFLSFLFFFLPPSIPPPPPPLSFPPVGVCLFAWGRLWD